MHCTPRVDQSLLPSPTIAADIIAPAITSIPDNIIQELHCQDKQPLVDAITILLGQFHMVNLFATFAPVIINDSAYLSLIMIQNIVRRIHCPMEVCLSYPEFNTSSRVCYLEPSTSCTNQTQQPTTLLEHLTLVRRTPWTTPYRKTTFLSRLPFRCRTSILAKSQRRLERHPAETVDLLGLIDEALHLSSYEVAVSF